MFEHIKTHLSRRQFRLLILLLFVASEYSFLVVPGTFAAGVEQILASSSTSISSNADGWIVMPKTPSTPRPVRPQAGSTNTTSGVSSGVSSGISSVNSTLSTPSVALYQKQISNADGWLTSNTSPNNGTKTTQ